MSSCSSLQNFVGKRLKTQFGRHSLPLHRAPKLCRADGVWSMLRGCVFKTRFAGHGQRADGHLLTTRCYETTPLASCLVVVKEGPLWCPLRHPLRGPLSRSPHPRRPVLKGAPERGERVSGVLVGVSLGVSVGTLVGVLVGLLWNPLRSQGVS